MLSNCPFFNIEAKLSTTADYDQISIISGQSNCRRTAEAERPLTALVSMPRAGVLNAREADDRTDFLPISHKI